ncbi:MAG: Slp family lipoprotein [Pseudomonadota bacterium]|nr:Slp family lipoprotein [Gammaproteobacteria bacterium]MBU1731536.1 Slp family lipoprotein [Gammaproteobacteria bacterium]MBU1893040.1 Slp family lipoprotein [Gammaproteobacteria bacterium]
MKIHPTFPGLMATLFLAGCAVIPLPRTDSALMMLTPDEVQKSGQVGVKVRWGGEIIRISPEPAQTCFEISSRPLDEEGEPLKTDRTFGRFMACAKEFYEPSVYAASRKLTVIGELAPAVVGKVGEHEYLYPMVKVEALHLWPVPQPVYYPPTFFYDPFWDFPFRYPFRRR